MVDEAAATMLTEEKAEKIARNVWLIALERLVALVQPLAIAAIIGGLSWLYVSVVDLREAAATTAKERDMVSVLVRVASLEKEADESQRAIAEGRRTREAQLQELFQRVVRLEEGSKRLEQVSTRIEDQNRTVIELLNRLILERRTEKVPPQLRATR